MQVHWSYEDGDKYTNYPDEINILLEKAYHEKKPECQWQESDGSWVTVNFAKNVETTAANSTVNVKRSVVGGKSVVCVQFVTL